jgi:DNA-binding transcriptional regulator YdaS (Cro superfamily)
MPVYFVRSGAAVKIGWAVDVARRVSTLQCGAPTQYELVRVVDGDRALEGAFHRHFGDRRLRGEWFRWSDDMLTTSLEIVPPPQTPFHRAVEICGGQTALAKKIGKRQSYVSMALHRMGKGRQKVAAEICALIEEATDGAVTRHDLRPDLWPQRAT